MKRSDYICTTCGNKLGKPTTGVSTYSCGVCCVCKEKSYVTECRDFGLGDEPSDDVDMLKNLFGIKNF